MDREESHRTTAPRRIADFDVIRPLGHGGSFVLARTPGRLVGLGPEIVLKAYPASVATDEDAAMTRVTDALRRMAAVRSDHLVRLIETGRDDTQFYCAMEYLPGGSLAAPAAQLTFAEVLRAVACAARGAHDLHEHGIAHGNIHPAGVILHADGARLADPGLAGHLNPGMTLTGRLGQPHLTFMAPAVLHGREPDRSTDLFSLGATLHFAATGQSLYPHVDESNPAAALDALTSSTPAITTGLPGPIETIVRQCIDPRADDRPTSTGDLADRLDSLWKR